MSERRRATGLILAKTPAAPRRGDLCSPACPSRGVLDHLTNRWGTLIMVALLEDTHRFSELRRTVGGVSEKMLSQTLQALERDGFVLREAYPVIPPRVDYSLTDLGREVAAHVETLDCLNDRALHILAHAAFQVSEFVLKVACGARVVSKQPHRRDEADRLPFRR